MRPFTAKFDIHAHSSSSLDLKNVDGDGYLKRNQSYTIDVAAVERQGGRDLNNRVKLNAKSELLIDGQSISSQEFIKTRDAIMPPHYNFVGETTHNLPARGVAEIRLHGNWTNGPLSSPFGSPLGFDHSLFIPGRP